ncbi:MAG: DNA repair protein RadA, partial [Gammaproteobacteria bacterium]|nr:DNA repair protein RadA [Gammaproteobacteria bacterium]
LVVFGEVGLTGEIRPVQEGQERLKEAKKHGFNRVIIPAANTPKTKMGKMQIFPVSKLSQAIEALQSL